MTFAYLGIGIFIALLFAAVIRLDIVTVQMRRENDTNTADFARWTHTLAKTSQEMLTEMIAADKRITHLENLRVRDIYAANLASGKFKRVVPAPRKRKRVSGR